MSPHDILLDVQSAHWLADNVPRAALAQGHSSMIAPLVIPAKLVSIQARPVLAASSWEPLSASDVAKSAAWCLMNLADYHIHLDVVAKELINSGHISECPARRHAYASSDDVALILPCNLHCDHCQTPLQALPGRRDAWGDVQVP